MKDPIQEFLKNWKKAQEKKDPGADSVYLATVDAEGRPYVRTVLLKQVPDGRFGFVTRRGGKKNEQIAHCNDVEICLHWSTLCLQVRMRCRAEPMDKLSLDFFWKRRPRDAQIVYSLDFEQDTLIPSFAFLEKQFQHLKKKLERIAAIPLSGMYQGYFLDPYMIEFLHYQTSRLNKRECYQKSGNGWKKSFLAP